MLRPAIHCAVFLVLTFLSQLGGLAYLVALVFQRRFLAFALSYSALVVAAMWIAPQFGREPVSCFGEGPLKVQSTVYCALNRTYVSPELADVLNETANEMDQRFPDTVTLLLDANLPFFDGFPLLPHLSHDDGLKADLAFYYRHKDKYLPGRTRSLIGYFAFEQGPTDCVAQWPNMRWDLELLQPFWQDYDLDLERTKAVVEILSADPRVEKAFIEPHLVDKLGLSDPKIRFQGCRAARHDDHIHFQIK